METHFEDYAFTDDEKLEFINQIKRHLGNIKLNEENVLTSEDLSEEENQAPMPKPRRRIGSVEVRELLSNAEHFSRKFNGNPPEK